MNNYSEKIVDLVTSIDDKQKIQEFNLFLKFIGDFESIEKIVFLEKTDEDRIEITKNDHGHLKMDEITTEDKYIIAEIHFDKECDLMWDLVKKENSKINFIKIEQNDYPVVILEKQVQTNIKPSLNIRIKR